MEIPTEWYIYILPGFVVLASILLFTNLNDFKNTISGKNNNFLSLTVVWGFIAYIIGLVGNSIALWVIKPFISCSWPPIVSAVNSFFRSNDPRLEGSDYAYLYTSGNNKIVDVLFESYQGMVLYRTLFCGFMLLFVFSVWNLWIHKRYDRRTIRWWLMSFSIIGALALFIHWQDYRKNHNYFVNEIKRTVISSTADADSSDRSDQ